MHEFFTLCIVFIKVISLIYEKIYFGDRVPLTDLHDKHEECVNTLDDVITIEVKNLNELEKIRMLKSFFQSFRHRMNI